MVTGLGDCFRLAVFLIIKRAKKFWATFFLGKSGAFILTTNGLGHTLG
jgi:hypothetical protein